MKRIYEAVLRAIEEEAYKHGLYASVNIDGRGVVEIQGKEFSNTYTIPEFAEHLDNLDRKNAE